MMEADALSVDCSQVLDIPEALLNCRTQVNALGKSLEELSPVLELQMSIIFHILILVSYVCSVYDSLRCSLQHILRFSVQRSLHKKINIVFSRA